MAPIRIYVHDPTRLHRLAINRPESEVTPTTLALQRIAASCIQAPNLESLRGYEGTAAGRYFLAYGDFFRHLPHSRDGVGVRRTMP